MNPNTIIAARSGQRREHLLKKIRESEGRLLPADIHRVQEALVDLTPAELQETSTQVNPKIRLR